jgi:hypothetical protein
MLAQSPDTITVESFPGSPLQRATRLLTPSTAARIAARLRRGTLDRGLRDGAEPDASPLIAARAAQLSATSTRARIADGLERLAQSADNPRSRARILPSRAAMLANRSELLEIADILRRDRPLYARGVAMLELILTDGAGPAYTDRRGEVLAGQLEIARASLTS